MLADFVLEQAVEESVQQHEQDDGVGHHHDEVLQCTSEEEAILALHLLVFLVGVGVVVGEGGQDLLLDERQLLRVDDFLLFAFDEPDETEDILCQPCVLVAMVGIEPEVVCSEEEESDVPESQAMEKGVGNDEHIVPHTL